MLIFSEKEIRGWVDELNELPDRLKMAREAYERAKFQSDFWDGVKFAQEEVDSIEADIAFEIANEMVEEEGKKPKKKFANASDRDRELLRRRQMNEAWIHAVNELAQAKQEHRKLKNATGKAYVSMKTLTDRYYSLQTILEAAGRIEGGRR